MDDYTLTTKQVAKILGITHGRVRQMVASKELDSIIDRRDRLVSVKSVERAKKRKTKPGPAAKTSRPAKPKK